MSKRVSTCLYIDRAVLETAKRIGLNISKVSENPAEPEPSEMSKNEDTPQE